MLNKIAQLLSFRKQVVVNLERQEPRLNMDEDTESFEIQMEREFAYAHPAPALNPAYLQAMTQAVSN